MAKPKKLKTYTFNCTLKGTAHGYVVAANKAEALAKLNDGEWEDILDEDTEVGDIDPDSIELCDEE